MADKLFKDAVPTWSAV